MGKEIAFMEDWIKYILSCDADPKYTRKYLLSLKPEDLVVLKVTLELSRKDNGQYESKK